eukprot:CAMPEP_0185208204 /NCGR_PEP_ID=MMETSP1140-20130426/61673_1 /TAXON_ID=298111 /ORGANISM="Pavlova sp., Strain CCMP459" /LENGTH=55 /DNA_ID=CAMNT_0027775921 /DNA_START=199 /DNA_END=366 /DNA_ORIENTATION=+
MSSGVVCAGGGLGCEAGPLRGEWTPGYGRAWIPVTHGIMSSVTLRVVTSVTAFPR